MFEEVFHIDNTGGDTFETLVVENSQFVMDMVGELKVYNIEDISNPTLIDEFDDGGIGHNMHIVEDLLYLADHYQGLEIYNISNTTSIVKLGQITDDADGEIDGEFVSNDIAYVSEWHDSSWDWSMKIINVTDPTNPTLISEYTDDDNEFIRFSVQEDICFVSCLSSGFKVLNVSDPTNILEITRFENWNVFNFIVENNRAFIADSALGLRILDVTDVTNIVQVGNYSTTQPVFGLDTFEDILFLGEHDAGILVLNISDVVNPTQICNYTVNNLVGITYSNDVIFLSMHRDGLLALRLTPVGSNNSTISLAPILGAIPIIALINRKRRSRIIQYD